MRSVSFGVPSSQRSHRERVSPCAGKAQVTAGKDLYVSESTDLVGTGAQDATGSSEAPAASGTTGRSRRRGSGLTGMLLPELQQLAAELGISGTARMRKGDLVAAISARQVGGESANGSVPAPAASPESSPTGYAGSAPAQAEPLEAPVSGGANSGPVVTPEAEGAPTRRRRGASRPAGSPSATETAAPDDNAPSETSAPAESAASTEERTDGDRSTRNRDRQRNRDGRDGENRTEGRTEDRTDGRSEGRTDGRTDGRADGEGRQRTRDGNDRPGNRNDNRDGNRGPEINDRGGRPDNRDANRDTNRDANRDGSRDGCNRADLAKDNADFEAGRGRRGRRYRDRNRRGGSGRDRFDQGEPTLSEDDVLLPVAGILDVLDNYAFVRTSGYLTGPNDVYVSLSQVRRYGLRRGDAITGAVRQPREGERKDKYNALVRLDTVNGLEPEQARNRPEFTKLTPLYPQDRLRLETEPHLLTTRVIDLVMPIGKGQRALIVSPPKAGKTMVLQSIANAITTNNPECHLMVVLVDERPEEVTDMQRSVKGEVI